jgi:hypothetical protein
MYTTRPAEVSAAVAETTKRMNSPRIGTRE